MARYDDLNTTAIAYATLVSSILLVIIILLVRALSYYWIEDMSARRIADAHYVSADAEIAAQKEMLDKSDQYEVEVAQPDGTMTTETRKRLPLSQAKTEVLKKLSSAKSDDTDA